MGRAARGKPRRGQTSRFTRSEITEMEKILLERKDDSLDQSFFQKLTEKFNLASGRVGSRIIQLKQVQRWFQNRLKNHATAATSSPTPSKEVVVVSDASLSNTAPESSSDMPKDTGEKVPDLLELEFEAKSSRDGAWYDVATFLAHRVVSSGEPDISDAVLGGFLEVRVRFQGFSADEDEWVNIKKAVRERSIPLESSECRKVEVGDLVLCFRESDEQATYFDAHIVEIQRKLHDIRGCRCLFLIRYDHDQTEERVPLRRLCRRPSY